MALKRYVFDVPLRSSQADRDHNEIRRAVIKAAQPIQNAEETQSSYNHRFAVAPMIDWTDRRCRFFHRRLTKRALLYTEMIVADAILHGNQERVLGFDDCEHPVALQLGGSDPKKLAEAARIGAEFGYDEINLNVGCPSDRVQSGAFGACLMQVPHIVAEAVQAMKAEVSIPVTVKCRIGVDEQDIEPALDELADRALASGADALWVHARKAWLQGLSPKENREIPPLNYDRVYRLKQRLPNVFIGMNGGLATPEAGASHLAQVDGVMLGRAAYNNPALLSDVDHLFYGDAPQEPDWAQIFDEMVAYAEEHIASGGRLIHIVRHMVGLFHGLPGARRYRQILSSDATKYDAKATIMLEALAQVDFTPADASAVA